MSKKFNNLFVRLSLKEQTLLIKRLAYLLTAGIPILESLNMLKRQAKSRSKKKILESLVEDVAKGQFLSVALKKFKYIFGDLAINIIRVGETSGTLDENLRYLAEEMNKKQILRRKIISALIYPVFIMVASLGIVVLLTVYIFPKILPIFESLGSELPLSTKALIVISHFFINYGFITLGLILAGVVIFWILFKKVSVFHNLVDKVLIVFPVSGKIMKSYNMSNICRTLGLLLKSDIRIVEAIRITGDSVKNTIYRKELKILEQKVTKGESMSPYLEERTQYFPEMVGQMIAVGERTGSLSDTLLYLAKLYEEEIDDITKNLSGVIEPLLMILMGVIVGFVAISVITPIYQITQSIHP